MQGASLVLVPGPGIGHLVSTVRLGEELVLHDDRISIYILMMKLPFEAKDSSYLDTLSVPCAINLLQLPPVYSSEEALGKGGGSFLPALVEAYIPHVRAAVMALADSPDVPRLAGFVLDMFCTCMMDVADELSVPSYLFYTSSASVLGMLLHLQALHDQSGAVLGEDSSSEIKLTIPSFANPVPEKLMPSVLMGKSEGVAKFMSFARNFRKARGIMVNTCRELESYAFEALANSVPGCPPVYAVGPLLDPSVGGEQSEVFTWLDQQPDSSVVFLCFGSYGSFRAEQVQEIALALERSGCRFLWSLRQPSQSKLQPPSDYSDPAVVLPRGFLERTAATGRVMGWAPQTQVLAHKAIGGFVSHCGWNSALESLWFGVPIATWPLYAEQQVNAFLLVNEIRAALEIAMDYRKDGDTVLGADVVEQGIRKLMEEENNEVKENVKKLRQMCRAAVREGGSSNSSLANFVRLVVGRHTS